MVSEHRKENLVAKKKIKIQLGQVKSEENEFDEELIKPNPRHVKSPRRPSKESNSSSVLKPSNGSTLGRVSSPAPTVSIHETSSDFNSNRSHTTSVSSIELDGILQHNSTLQTKPVSPGNNQISEKNTRDLRKNENVHMTYKKETSVDLSKTYESQRNAPNKRLTNERSGLTPRYQEETSFVTKTSLRTTQRKSHSSETSVSYRSNQSTRMISSGDNKAKTVEDTELNQKYEQAGSFASDLHEGIQQDKNLNSSFSAHNKQIERQNIDKIEDDKHIKEESQTTTNEKEEDEENRSQGTKCRLSRKDQLRVAMDWQHKLQLQIETLSWKYKSLETEYEFLEKLIAEQREDLSKARVWAKHAAETRSRAQESLTYSL